MIKDESRRLICGYNAFICCNEHLELFRYQNLICRADIVDLEEQYK